MTTKTRAKQREEEIRAEMADYLSHVHVPPSALWSTGSEPATERQIGYIKTDAALHEDMSTWDECSSWTKAQASEYIQKVRDARAR